MKLFITLITIFSVHLSFGQSNCRIKLIDSYSLEEIEVDSNIHVEKLDFSLDTIGNYLVVNKPKGKLLNISVPNYNLYSEKINLKKYSDDTLTRKITPTESLILKRFEEIWKSESKLDTMYFASGKELEKHIFSFVNYLSVLNEYCENGLCNYSNTYKYEINFTKSESYFSVSKVKKILPLEYNCEELENHLQKLILIFPKFQLETEQENLTFNLFLML